MADDRHSIMGKTLDPFTGTRPPGSAGNPRSASSDDDFPSDFARLKLSIIRPAFEAVGNMLKARGHECNVSEEPGGKISIHIVPAGVNKSIHAYDWFPTFSFIGAPFTKTVGLHGRNMRPNSEATSGSRGDYKPAHLIRELVEKELMKFIGEIANW